MKTAYTTLALFLALTISASTPQEKTSDDKHLQFKKTFIWAFTKYVKWPMNKMGDKFEIAVYDYPEILPYLEQLKHRYENVSDLPLEIIDLSLKSMDEIDLEGIEIIITSGQDNQNMLSEISKRSKSSTLQICDVCDSYNMIRFFEIDDKTKFDLNKTNIESAGLTVSDPLVDLSDNNRK